MRNLLFTFGFLLFTCPAFAAPAVVNSTIGSSNTSVTSIATGNISTTSGNLIACDYALYGSGVTASVSDSVGLSWATMVTIFQSSVDSATRIGGYYAENITGNASHNFTLNATGAGFLTIICKQITGVFTSGALDQTAIGETAVGNTTHTTASTATTAQAEEILIGAASSFDPTSFTATGGFVQDQQQVTDASHEGLISASRVVSSTGAYAFTFTTSNSEETISYIATFRGTAAAVVGKRAQTIVVE